MLAVRFSENWLHGSSAFFRELATIESTIGLPIAWCPCVVSPHERHGISNHKQLDPLLNSYATRLSF